MWKLLGISATQQIESELRILSAKSNELKAKSKLWNKNKNFDKKEINPEYLLSSINASCCDGGLTIWGINFANENTIKNINDYTCTSLSKSDCCKTYNNKNFYQPCSTGKLKYLDIQEIKNKLNDGPLQIAVQGEVGYLQFYKIKKNKISLNDIIKDDLTSQVDHAVQLVGWNSLKINKNKSIDYWIIRNSWGASGVIKDIFI